MVLCEGGAGCGPDWEIHRNIHAGVRGFGAEWGGGAMGSAKGARQGQKQNRQTLPTKGGLRMRNAGQMQSVPIAIFRDDPSHSAELCRASKTGKLNAPEPQDGAPHRPSTHMVAFIPAGDGGANVPGARCPAYLRWALRIIHRFATNRRGIARAVARV